MRAAISNDKQAARAIAIRTPISSIHSSGFVVVVVVHVVECVCDANRQTCGLGDRENSAYTYRIHTRRVVRVALAQMRH